MKRLLTREEFVRDSNLSGTEEWMTKEYQAYVIKQRHKVARDEVSTSYYLYGVEATHFNSLVTSQETFISFRERYLERVIRQIQMIDIMLRDDERLNACWDAQKWCTKMNKELGE